MFFFVFFLNCLILLVFSHCFIIIIWDESGIISES